MPITLKPIKVNTIAVTIVGVTPLIQHKWSEKALKQIREKKGGKKTKNREPCDPEKEAAAAMHRTEKGVPGIPACAVKACLINAAHKDSGIEKTLVRKSLFVECADAEGVLPIRSKEPRIREDPVRVSSGGTDLRYRPEFPAGWECDLEITYNSNNLTPDDVVNLLNAAGFGVGLLEMRPEKGREYGRFRVKTEEK
jgi:hypothetical protein